MKLFKRFLCIEQMCNLNGKCNHRNKERVFLWHRWLWKKMRYWQYLEWTGLAWFRREKLGTKPSARNSSSVTPILVYWQHLISERHVGQKEKRRLFLNLDSRDHGVWWPWILDIKGWVIYKCLPSNHAFNYLIRKLRWVILNSGLGLLE